MAFQNSYRLDKEKARSLAWRPLRIYLSTQVAREDLAFLIRLYGGTRLGCPTLNLFFGTQYMGPTLVRYSVHLSLDFCVK